MTVAVQTSKAGPYICDGVQKEYPFVFPVMDAAHIAVYAADGENGYARRLTEGYRVELAETGGTVVLDEPLPKGHRIAIIRSVPVTQETDIQNNTAFFPEIMEDAFDKLTMIVQQQSEVLDRCAKVPVTSTEDPVEYLQTLSTVSTNAKDVALNAADAAAHSALTASISERNMSLIWAELTGDSSLADNALITVKEAAEASGAIKTAKEIAIGEINGVGATVIASTEKAAKEALDAAKAATDSAGDITGRVDDAITIQVSQAVGADGVLGAAIAAGVLDVEAARQQALDRANATLSEIMQGSQAFNESKEQGLSEISQKVAGVAFDVETILARAQTIADGYLADAQATVSGSIADLEKMKADAIAAGKTDLVALIEKRIGELNTLAGYLTDAESAADAADTFRQQTQGLADDALAGAQAAASSASGASTSASNALKSAQDAAVSASNANASALAAGSAATEAAQTAAANSITAHNANSNAHAGVLLSCAGGTMRGSLRLSGNASIGRSDNNLYTYVFGSSDRDHGAYLLLTGQGYATTGVYFQIGANQDGSGPSLLGYNNGWLKWNDKHIVRSVDGVNADGNGNVTLNAFPKIGGQLTGQAITRNANNSVLILRGGNKGTGYEGELVLFGDEFGTEIYKGAFELRSGKGGDGRCNILRGSRSGELTWNGEKLLTEDDKAVVYPNWSAGVVITGSVNSDAGATISENGWVLLRKNSTTPASVLVNGAYAWGSCNHSGGGDDNGFDMGMIPVAKGDIVTRKSGSVESGNNAHAGNYSNITLAIFYPCK